MVQGSGPTTSHAPLVAGEPWVAYQTQGVGKHGVFLVRPDGSGAFFALQDLPGGIQLHPDWSPDGRHLVLDVENETGTADLWIVDTADWSAQRIVSCEAPCLWVNEPAWSRDGTSIAFQRHTLTDAGETSSVEILALASRTLTTVYETAPGLGVFAPRWSPDGGSLAFEQVVWDGEDLAGISLEVLDLASPGATRTIVPADRMANNVDWSPDGTLIAFSAPIEGGEPGGAKSDLWLVAPDGTGLRRVTDVAAAGGAAVHPTFTPDGSHLMFKLSDMASGVRDVIATIALDGTDLRSGAGAFWRGGWHPRLRPTA
jgi:Tol biopolymer transport system component